ncbi:MAG: c-type cytochrome [Candidatus Sulfotelmatobacter sp.]
MRITKFITLLVVISLSVSIALPAFAANGAGLYKTKCAACHGAEGQGKIGPAVKGISLSGNRSAICSPRGRKQRRLRTKRQWPDSLPMTPRLLRNM